MDNGICGSAGGCRCLIFDLIFLFFPGTKSAECFVAHNVLHGDAALGHGCGEFVIDELVTESYVVGILGGVAVVDACYAAPVYGAEAHGTGLA